MGAYRPFGVLERELGSPNHILFSSLEAIGKVPEDQTIIAICMARLPRLDLASDTIDTARANNYIGGERANHASEGLKRVESYIPELYGFWS